MHRPPLPRCNNTSRLLRLTAEGRLKNLRDQSGHQHLPEICGANLPAGPVLVRSNLWYSNNSGHGTVEPSARREIQSPIRNGKTGWVPGDQPRPTCRIRCIIGAGPWRSAAADVLRRAGVQVNDSMIAMPARWLPDLMVIPDQLKKIRHATPHDQFASEGGVNLIELRSGCRHQALLIIRAKAMDAVNHARAFIKDTYYSEAPALRVVWNARLIS